MTNQSPEQRRTEPRVGIRRGRGPGNPGVIEKARNPQEALQRLIPYLRPYTGALILVSLFVLSHTVLGLLGPYLIGITIDDYILRADIPGTIRMAVLMLVVYLSGAGFQAVSEWMMARVSQGVLKTMRRDLFEHLQSLSLRFFDQNPAGELMSRLTNDIDAINQAVSQNLVSIIASLLTLVGILIAMFVKLLVGAGIHTGGAYLVLVHWIRCEIHPPRVPAASKRIGKAQRHHGRDHQRPAGRESLPPQ
jgi:ATP-binding cassette subfamily B multidrug efflux pump